MQSTIFLFFNIGASELFIIVLVVIIFFGSKKIPELMRGLGKGMREFKNATSDIQEEITKSAREIEREVNMRKVPGNNAPSGEKKPASPVNQPEEQKKP